MGRATVNTILQARAAGGAITLRHPRWADYEDWSLLRRMNKDYLTPWEPAWGPTHLSRQAYKAKLGRFKKMVAQDMAFPFHVFRGPPEALIGACNLTHIERGVAQSAKLGYWIGQSYARKGFARAAVGAACQFGYETLGLHRIEAAVQPENEASIKVLEAVGFRAEGTARAMLKINGRWADHLIFARLSSD